MSNANAATFARVSYWLAGAASFIIATAFVGNVLFQETLQAISTQVCWLSLPVSAVGAFMGHTSRNALKKVIDEENPPDVWKKARSGAILNSILIAVGALAALVAVVSNLSVLFSS